MSVPRWQGEMRMKFERLKAMYDNGGTVHYKGKLYEVVGINELKQTAQIVEVGALFRPAIEKKAEELD